MRWTCLLLLVVFPVVGCRADVPFASSVPDETTAPIADVPQSTALQGTELETVAAGGWIIRRRFQPPAAEALDRMADARSARAPSGTGGGGAYRGPGGSVPPGSREPSDPTPPAPSAPTGPPITGGPSTPAPASSMDGLSDGPVDDSPALDSDAGDKEVARLRRAAAEGAGAPSPDAIAAPAPAAGPGAVPAPAPTNLPQLTAGTTDDNAAFDAFVQFLATWSDQEGVADRYDDVDVRGRRFVRVVDKNGRPVPGARVQVVHEAGDAVAWSGTTYGDGRVPYYPNAIDVAITETEPTEFLVEAFHGSARAEARWTGRLDDLTLTLDVETVLPDEIPLDVCFLIDTTGSMSDEIARIKATLLSVTEKLKGIAPEFSLRYGAVLYRDLTDDYVTKAHPFTSDIEAFATALQGVAAQGGGDTPESLNQGLAEGVGRLDWRPAAAKVMFLIADAPPHMDYEGDVRYGVSMRAAVDRGIRIHSVAASGLDPFGSLVFRQIAQLTRGKFIFIEYGGNVAASGARHGVSGAKKSNNLDDILFEQIQDELGAWGRDPAARLDTALSDR